MRDGGGSGGLRLIEKFLDDFDGAGLDHLRSVLGHKVLSLLHEGSLRLFVWLRGRSRTGRHCYANLGKEFFLTCGCTKAQQTRVFLGSIGERMRRVRGNTQRFAGPHRRFFAPEGGFDLAFEQGKGFLKVVAMGRRAAAGWDVHIDQAVSTVCVIAGEQDGVGITD